MGRVHTESGVVMKRWEAEFTSEELARIRSAPTDSIMGRLARLLDEASPQIPDRGQMAHAEHTGAAIVGANAIKE